MNYNWLKLEAGPKVIVEAMKLYGIKEVPGEGDNDIILEWAKELGISYYKDDSTPWCGLFTAIVVKRSEFIPVKESLRARNWAGFGTQQSIAMLGDVLVFSREGGGHVGFYVGEDKDCYHVLGGNQGDMVKVSRILRNRCIAIRRCPWKISQPKEVRIIVLKSDGEVSKNEA